MWKAGILALLLAGPALAQQFTTAAEVKPILGATKSSWVALREFDGRDLLYFTQLESWRCGLTAVRYSVNGRAMEPWMMDPCFEGTAQPNAMSADRSPYTSFDLGAVKVIDVIITYDDGTEESATYTRSAVLMPG